MLQKYEDADRVFREGEPILGRGWKEVEAFDDLEDVDEYESDEEEMYVVMDLGNGIDNKSLLAENSYQLIGLDTPLPFLKLGNHVYQGEPVKMIGDEIIFGRIRSEQPNRLMKDEEDPQKSERPPWHTTSLRLRFRPIILRDKDQASAETHGREDSPSITSAQTTRPGVKSSFNNSGPSHQAPPTLPSQVEVSGKPFYQRAPAVLGAGGTRISPLPPLSKRSVTPSVGPRSSVSPTKAGLEELEAVWRQSNTPTSVNQDLPRETSAPPPGSHISDIASLHTRLNDTSLSPEKEAGPSRIRSRASSAAQGSLSFGISKKTRESILKANLLPKVDGKLLLAKISDLSVFDVDQYPKEARFVLSKEVEEFLKPRTTEKHAIEVQKRGYTTMELRHVLAGKPMKGVGSRPGAQKTKIHGIDVPSGDLGVDEEDGHLGQGGQGPSTVLPFVVETRIADEKKGKGRGKERSQGGAKSTSAPGESMAVDDLEKGIDNGAIGFEEEDDPLVTIDDIDMTF